MFFSHQVTLADGSSIRIDRSTLAVRRQKFYSETENRLFHSWTMNLLTYFLTYLLTYVLTPWSKVLPEKLTGSQLVKKFPAVYGTRRFITAFTSARHLSLFWDSSIQSIPLHTTSWSSILILSSHQCLRFPSGLFPSGFPTKTLYTLLIYPIRATGSWI